MEPLRGLFLNTDHGGQIGPSGYARLMEFFEGSKVIEYPRKDPKSYASRLLTRILNIGAATKSYRWGSFRCEWKAKGLCRTETPQFIHLLWGDHDWGYLDKLIPPSIPLIGTFHQPPSILWDMIPDPSRLERFDHIILMSPGQAHSLHSRYGVPLDKMTFIPHGIDCKAFRPLDQTAAANGKFRLLHVGSYLRNFHLLEGLSRKLRDHPNIELEIIAPPHVLDTFPELSGNIFRSYLSSEELLDAYQKSDCLLMTVNEATANNAILEGLACGLPVVCEESSGIRAYTGEKAAFFTEKDNPEDMLDKVLKLAGDAVLQKEMGKQARIQAECLDWEKTTRQLSGIYRDAIKNKATQSD
ncbi:MAG: glycosyltransferase family 4 protein [Puniceicoccaceae bacterium]